ncbi:MAG: YfhO family protein [Acidobacteriota bacterium]|nr:YfhO family protein [Acidobacteriota bacterium]
MNGTWLFVGVLYAAGVALARRAHVRLPRRIALLFFLLVLLFLWRPLTGDDVLVSADVIRLVPPWSELRAPKRPPVTKYDVSNLNLHDVPMQIVPWMHQVREAWRAFEVPLWNPAAGGGMPLLANGQSTPLSPLRLLTLPLSLTHAVAAECAMRLLLALVLTFLFCRSRYSMFASVVAAVVYAFSTWVTVWLQFPIATAAAFLPGVLLAIERLIEDATRRRFIGAALLFAVAVLSGHPETIFHVSLIAAAYGIWIAIVERGAPRRLLPVIGASLVAMLLASPFLVPFAEAVLRSQRLAELHAPRESIVPPFSDFASAILLLQPRFFGQLPIERPWGPTTLESICGFAGVLAIASAIALAIFIVRTRRFRERETLYLLAILFSLAVILGWPLITPLFHAIAGLAPPMRLRMALCWFGALSVAATIDATRRENTRVPLLTGTLCVALTMLWLLMRVEFPSPSHRVTAVLSLLPSIAVLLALTLPRIRFHAAALLTLVELWLAIAYWNSALPQRELYPRTPLIATLQQMQRADNQPFRILGTGGMLYPNVGAMYGFEDVRVHDPMAYAPYVDFLAKTVDWNAADYYAKWNDTATPLLDFLNVKYVATTSEISDPRYEQRYSGRDGRIYVNRTVLPRFYATRNVLIGGDLRQHSDYRYTAIVEKLPRRFAAELTAPWTTEDARVDIVRASASAFTLRIHAPRTTLVVSSIPNYPGWRVPFPKLAVNGPFLGFVVPRGDHTIRLAYRPLSFYVTSAIALLTLATLLVLLRTPRADRRA